MQRSAQGQRSSLTPLHSGSSRSGSSPAALARSIASCCSGPALSLAAFIWYFSRSRNTPYGLVARACCNCAASIVRRPSFLRYAAMFSGTPEPPTNASSSAVARPLSHTPFVTLSVICASLRSVTVFRNVLPCAISALARRSDVSFKNPRILTSYSPRRCSGMRSRTACASFCTTASVDE
jgi:hypothetical protein